MTKATERTAGRISDAAVERATGRTWAAWLALLDAAGAADWAHKDVAAFLAATHGLSPWWSQMVAVDYERARGLRVTGETAGAGFEVGAQRTIALPQERAWELLTSPRGLAVWLGDLAGLTLAAGRAFATAIGIAGTVRVFNPPHHLRMAWQCEGWRRPSTLQVRAVPAGRGKTSLRFHHEQLAGERVREEMRRWQDALAELAALAEGEG